MKRHVSSFNGALLLVTALAVPTISLAQSPFDGTWKTNMAATKFSPKPIVFYLSQGWYHCVSCNPAIDVQANGEDQAVTGQAFDSVSVKETDPKTISVVTKKDGKVLAEQTRTVSADGKTLTVKTTVHPLTTDAPINVVSTAKLVGIAPAAVHATSGQWKTEKVQQSENALLTTYKSNGDELSMSTPVGESYTAKLDGNDYPVKGTPGRDTVSLKKIDAHTIEETSKRKGTVIEVDKITVNGKTMTIVSTNKLTDRTATFTANKQ